MRTAKYSRIVVRIAAREGISLRRAATLYQYASRLRIRDLGTGLVGRVNSKRASLRVQDIPEGGAS